MATDVREQKFNSRWLFLVILLLAILIATLIINLNKTNNFAERVIGTVTVDNGDEKINWGRYQTVNVNLTDSYKIMKSGIYHLTGSIPDGSITIDITKEDVVKLILDNVTIKNSTGPAISCLDGDDLVIELVGENSLEDGAEYSGNLNEDIEGALYSRADLTFEGDGILNLTGNYQDGIVAKDDLKIKSGTYNITAADDAIRGKDSVYILNGDFKLESTADAIKSTNETTAGKGFILIENGTFDIKSGAKGIKAINSILIYGGEYEINSYDDAIHSNNYVGIIDGEIKIDSGDDGIHADRELIIDGGNIVIEKSYEALEAQAVTIYDGEISLISSDDGINAGGGADGSSMNRMGANPFDADENCVLTINGGDIYINAAGDGVDSNGYLYFNGGKVIVDGPTNNGNGALDSGIDIVMNGGEVIAIGASGMAEDLGSGSTIYNISIYFKTTELAGTKVEIKDSDGKTILNHTSAKSFNHIAAGSEDFIPTKTYTIYIDDEEYESFTISNIVTTVGNSYDIMKQRR
ncbi:carbohydrate-binding domain-containing protein [Candidatus Saccharibacteria bacterium]|nr:carbohydrate-binding domain-containing protein [Candidatus Saccharibacteria bacterium]